MTFEEFCEYLPHQMHETIYNDSEGRTIVVIRAIDLYALVTDLVNKKLKDNT